MTTWAASRTRAHRAADRNSIRRSLCPATARVNIARVHRNRFSGDRERKSNRSKRQNYFHGTHGDHAARFDVRNKFAHYSRASRYTLVKTARLDRKFIGERAFRAHAGTEYRRLRAE